MTDLRKIKEEMIQRLTNSDEKAGIPRDVAYKAAIKRAEQAMPGVDRETGGGPIEIRGK